MTLNQNQFNQSPVQGQMDLQRSKNLLSCEVDVSSAGGLIPGQAVKLVDQLGKLPHVVECAADSDLVFGYIAYNLKDRTYAALDRVEISTGADDVMYMTAAGALSVLTPIMPVIASKKVTAATGGKPISGYNLDKASADGDLIRVVVACPAFFKM